MCSYVFVLSVFLIWSQGAVESVRITELRVPAHVAEGGEALLGCRYDLEGDSLYSLRWYKDGKEFYRYVPKAGQPMKIFFVAGVNVDLNHSSSNFIALKHLMRESAGVYRCEVYGETPKFTMVFQEKHVAVDLIPSSGPEIVGLEKEYHHGSRVDVNCTTTPSRPEAQLAWFINELPAPQHYLGRAVLVLPTSYPHAYQPKLNLHFPVYESHFDRGVLTLKCEATIPPLYHKETVYTFYDKSLLPSEEPPSAIESNSTGRASMLRISISYQILFVFSIFILHAMNVC